MGVFQIVTRHEVSAEPGCEVIEAQIPVGYVIQCVDGRYYAFAPDGRELRFGRSVAGTANLDRSIQRCFRDLVRSEGLGFK